MPKNALSSHLEWRLGDPLANKLLAISESSARKHRHTRDYDVLKKKEGKMR
jgi:hypothetical protein